MSINESDQRWWQNNTRSHRQTVQHTHKVSPHPAVNRRSDRSHKVDVSSTVEWWRLGTQGGGGERGVHKLKIGSQPCLFIYPDRSCPQLDELEAQRFSCNNSQRVQPVWTAKRWLLSFLTNPECCQSWSTSSAIWLWTGHKVCCAGLLDGVI